MKQKVKYKGILFIVLSALCFAFMNMFVRMAGDLTAVQKRKLEVYDFAGRLRNIGDPV